MAQKHVVIWSCDRCDAKLELENVAVATVKTISYRDPNTQAPYSKEVCDKCYDSFLQWLVTREARAAPQRRPNTPETR